MYLQYFSHSLAVTVASRVAVAVVSQVSYRVITYNIVTILSCRRYNLNGQKVIEYYFVNLLVTKCSHCLVSQLST